MNLDLSMSVDLQEVTNFIESDKFVQFLLNNTTDISTCAFILQTIHDKITELQKEGE